MHEPEFSKGGLGSQITITETDDNGADVLEKIPVVTFLCCCCLISSKAMTVELRFNGATNGGQEFVRSLMFVCTVLNIDLPEQC